jgi:hypothetical protein
MTQEQSNINLQDLATVVNIIDACSQRGAIKGDELAVVGQLREKFFAIVKANTSVEKVSEEEVGE